MSIQYMAKNMPFIILLIAIILIIAAISTKKEKFTVSVEYPPARRSVMQLSNQPMPDNMFKQPSDTKEKVMEKPNNTDFVGLVKYLVDKILNLSTKHESEAKSTEVKPESKPIESKPLIDYEKIYKKVNSTNAVKDKITDNKGTSEGNIRYLGSFDKETECADACMYDIDCKGFTYHDASIWNDNEKGWCHTIGDDIDNAMKIGEANRIDKVNTWYKRFAIEEANKMKEYKKKESELMAKERIKLEMEEAKSKEELTKLRDEMNRRIVEEQSAKVRSEEIIAKLKAESESVIKRAELESSKKAEEIRIAEANANEAKRRADAEVDTRRKVEAQMSVLRAEEEVTRKKIEEESILRKAAEEAARKNAEYDALRIKAEQEATRLKAETDAARRRADEAEMNKALVEQERIKMEEEMRRKMLEIEQEKKRIEEDRRIAIQEAERLKNAEISRINAEKEARMKAEEEALKKAEEEARKKAEDAELKRKAEEDAARKLMEEENRRKIIEEARLKREKAIDTGYTIMKNKNAFWGRGTAPEKKGGNNQIYLGNKRISDPKECAGICYDMPDCKGFTWHTANYGLSANSWGNTCYSLGDMSKQEAIVHASNHYDGNAETWIKRE